MSDDELGNRALTRGGGRRRSTRDVDAPGERDAEGDHWLEVWGPWRMPKPPEPPEPRVPISPLVSVEREAYVEQLWRMLYTEQEIAELVAKHFGPACTGQVVARDLKVIKQKYLAVERDPLTISSRKARLRSSLEMLFQHSIAAGDRTSARFVLDRLAKLDGLFAPQKIELTNTSNAQLTVEAIVDALETDEELRAFEIVVAALERRGLHKHTSELGVDAIDVGVDK